MAKIHLDARSGRHLWGKRGGTGTRPTIRAVT